MFEYTSKEFVMKKDMEMEKKELTNALCEFLGLNRNQFRLQQGCVRLQGFCNGNWINLTSHISSFKDYMNSNSYSSFRLKTKLQVK